MAWSVPLTAISNATLTAAQWNASVRDNLLETAVAKATAGGQIFVSTAANALAARQPTAVTVATSENTTNTSYVALTTAGPAVTVTTGTAAIVCVSAQITDTTATANAYASVAISGATTVAANDVYAVMNSGSGTVVSRQSAVTMIGGLTPGSNTFTMLYRVSAGTGAFAARHLLVIPL